MKNQFDQHIKQSLENYEVKYNPAHWEDMQNRLNKTNIGKSSSAGKVLGIAAGIIAVAGMIYYFSATDSENNKEQRKNLTTVQNVVSKEAKVAEEKSEVRSQKSEGTANNNSEKEKTISENKVEEQKTISNELQTSNNTNENKSNEQEQPKNNNLEPLTANAASLSATFHCNQNLVCAGNQVQFTADNTAVSCSYRWDFGDGKTSGEQSPKHLYQNAGTYTVKLRLTSTKNKVSDEQKNMLVVNPIPNIDMNYFLSDENPSLINFLVSIPTNSGEAKDGSVHPVGQMSNGIKEWSWDFGDRQSSSEQNPIHQYNKKGNYDAVVTATNNFGCSSSYRKLMHIENDFNLLAPTGFSPNGDGLNDTWMPAALANGNYKLITLTIYDKAVNPVYKISDKNHAWDGANTKIGETFSWKAVVKDKNGKESTYSGFITIAE